MRFEASYDRGKIVGFAAVLWAASGLTAVMIWLGATDSSTGIGLRILWPVLVPCLAITVWAAVGMVRALFTLVALRSQGEELEFAVPPGAVWVFAPDDIACFLPVGGPQPWLALRLTDKAKLKWWQRWTVRANVRLGTGFDVALNHGLVRDSQEAIAHVQAWAERHGIPGPLSYGQPTDPEAQKHTL